jgi:glucose-1-phosphate thymidylyltransferase
MEPSDRKGIILAGGTGSRLFPATTSVSKQLLPVYDKPLVYYPLTTLMLSGIRDILLIATPRDVQAFRSALGTGEQWGLSLTYAVQEKPEGIAQAFLIAEAFLDGNPCALILGDNIFYGHQIGDLLRQLSVQPKGASIVAYRVEDPSAYGVVTFDRENRPLNLVEKPSNPSSPWAITGLYFVDESAPQIARAAQPSARGELEIVSVLSAYLNRSDLQVVNLGRGFAWFDAGTHDSLFESSEFVRTIQHRQGLKIACPEEIAFRLGYIGLPEVTAAARRYAGSQYGRYLEALARIETEEVAALEESRPF